MINNEIKIKWWSEEYKIGFTSDRLAYRLNQDKSVTRLNREYSVNRIVYRAKGETKVIGEKTLFKTLQKKEKILVQHCPF
jgi:hypothetical protein